MFRKKSLAVRGSANERYNRLKKANVLDRIPDRLDPSTIVIDDEDDVKDSNVCFGGSSKKFGNLNESDFSSLISPASRNSQDLVTSHEFPYMRHSLRAEETEFKTELILVTPKTPPLVSHDFLPLESKKVFTDISPKSKKNEMTLVTPKTPCLFRNVLPIESKKNRWGHVSHDDSGLSSPGLFKQPANTSKLETSKTFSPKKLRGSTTQSKNFAIKSLSPRNKISKKTASLKLKKRKPFSVLCNLVDKKESSPIKKNLFLDLSESDSNDLLGCANKKVIESVVLLSPVLKKSIVTKQDKKEIKHKSSPSSCSQKVSTSNKKKPLHFCYNNRRLSRTDSGKQSSAVKLRQFSSKNITKHSPYLKKQSFPSIVEVFAKCSPIVQSLIDKEISVNGKRYLMLSEIGKGASCHVFSAFNRIDKTIVAIKCVNVARASFDVLKAAFFKEIEYLNILKGSQHVIKLYDSEFVDGSLFMVLELGNIDLQRFLADAKIMENISPLMIKFYWSQMLKAVNDIHKHGIIHADLKPANFLIVSGNLKLIDFGISAKVPEDMTSVIRGERVGTLNFMSPESITAYTYSTSNKHMFKVGTKSDVWSLGCILYNLVYGQTPFQHIEPNRLKIEAIINPSHEISFPETVDDQLLDVMKRCLERDVKKRASTSELLDHPYLRNECKYSALIPVKNDFEELCDKIKCCTPQEISTLSKLINGLTSKFKIDD